MPAEIIPVLVRWIHIITASVMIGGTAFQLLILHWAASSLPDEARAQLRERVVSRWRIMVMAGIALLTISGLYNYHRVATTEGWLKSPGMYHAVMGTKILLALVVFFLASALSGRAAAFEKLRQNPTRWLTVTLVLAAIVVALGSYLKVTAGRRLDDRRMFAPSRAFCAQPGTSAGDGFFPPQLVAPPDRNGVILRRQRRPQAKTGSMAANDSGSRGRTPHGSHACDFERAGHLIDGCSGSPHGESEKNGVQTSEL